MPEVNLLYHLQALPPGILAWSIPRSYIVFYSIKFVLVYLLTFTKSIIDLYLTVSFGSMHYSLLDQSFSAGFLTLFFEFGFLHFLSAYSRIV